MTRDEQQRVELAAAALREGGMAILVDDANRENEGDLVFAAQHATPELVNFMKHHARGLICAPLLPERLQALELPLMVQHNTSAHHTAFTVSVDGLRNVGTGISALDMSNTLHALIDPETRPADLRRPGHVFPLRYSEGGVLKRRGQTEGAVDLCNIAGLYPAAVVCEICNSDGTMARPKQLQEYAQRFELPLVHISDIVAWRLRHEQLIQRVSSARLPTRFGEFQITGYEVPLTGEHHIALVMGDISGEAPVLCRLHSECLTGDTFHSQRCDCGEQLEYALQMIASEGRGVLLYLRQEGRGIGLINKLRAYALQDTGLDTVEANLALGLPADKREYSTAGQMLRDLGVSRVRALTNNPRKLVALEGYGIEIAERVPIPLHGAESPQGQYYLRTKIQRMQHLLDPRQLNAELIAEHEAQIGSHEAQIGAGAGGV
jgi:3,4-dihydroxy 2-butanone 4-phosphate synthase/GTP cyclohydrolase II